ncbi:hypothetical protein ACMFMG_007436 [Clarireedia jacksonii]
MFPHASTSSRCIRPSNLPLARIGGRIKSQSVSLLWVCGTFTKAFESYCCVNKAIMTDNFAHLLILCLATGHMNQAELSYKIDHFLLTPSGDIEHLHNQLISAIYANTTREMPDTGVASWVSANDKPTTGAGSKPVSGDAAEQRLKTEVMQLPSRDRRRLKDLTQNDVSLARNNIIPAVDNLFPSSILLMLLRLCLASIESHVLLDNRKLFLLAQEVSIKRVSTLWVNVGWYTLLTHL